MSDLDFSFTIVGLGLIGGSYAKALKKTGAKTIWGIDNDKEVLKMAEKDGVIDEGFISPKEPLKKSDIVIICLYPQNTIEFVTSNITYFKENSIVNDTSGVKQNVINDIQKVIRDDIDFIGGHPMAGKEKSGYNYSTSDLFKGANYLITLSDKNKRTSIKKIEKIMYKLGFSNVVKTTPKEHDKLIAYTSQLPHIIANSLILSNIRKDLSLFCGGSFEDCIRVAFMNPELWSELFITNKENILKSINDFQDNIFNIKEAIANDDKEKLINILLNGNKIKEGNNAN